MSWLDEFWDMMYAYAINPMLYIYYILSGNDSFQKARSLANFLNYMTWNKILKLKEILDRNTPFADFDNLKLGIFSEYMLNNRIGFFRGKTHILSVWSTESRDSLLYDNNEFDLEPRGYPRSLAEEQFWQSLGMNSVADAAQSK